jgi:pullulanase-type alpha-1,6-glucosidase
MNAASPAFLLATAGLALVLHAPALAQSVAAPTLADCGAGHAQVLEPVPAASRAMDAQALWLDATRLRWPGADAGARTRLLHSATGQVQATAGKAATGWEAALLLQPFNLGLPPATLQRAAWFGPGPQWAVPEAERHRLRDLHRGQLVLVQEDPQGQVLRATAVQHAAALDALYAAAETAPALGIAVAPAARGAATSFRLWAPTAQNVAVCLHADGAPATPASVMRPLLRDAATGVWQTREGSDLSGQTATYLVDVFVRGTGLVRQRVTDPYALSLNADSQRTWIGRLDAPATQPPGWRQTPRPQPLRAATDMAIYELHVRDFSAGDASVREPWRGKYLAFTEPSSAGMQHLRALQQAGITDVHLLPVFDLATVPETGCLMPDIAVLNAAVQAEGGASEAPQAWVAAHAARDCFNWGYDPWHFNAPEGSFATDAHDGAVRIRELRAMVQALHRAGLRVGMDVVYNHTTASGQAPQSVLDRIVPGYYQRLNAQGVVERSTCCDNTATEHMMMARLMIDSAVLWAREHRIDSFRFDLMGHQPRAAMERLQRAVNRAAGRPVQLIGEGWNFGEVAGGQRFVQASQLSLAGSGIGTFSDRARDAVRGGGAGDSGAALLQRQGWASGLAFDPTPEAQAAGLADRTALLRAADLVRVGLAGTLRGYRLTTHEGRRVPLAQIDYAGQPAGYASQPGEVVNYVENHDNQTLFDNHVFKLAPGTSMEDRARVQVLALATTTFSQGIAYFHAGVEILRSKNLDRNSYDSGDWFNRIDWTLQDNFFGTGLPPKADNGAMWALMAPRLANATLRPAPEHIRFTRDAFLDLMKLRSSSRLFRLDRAAEVQRRLSFVGTGPQQSGSVIAAHLDGRGLRGAGWRDVVYAINAGTGIAEVPMPALRGRALQLHPVHRAATAADPRPRAESQWDAAAGTLRVPPRTALVYVAD